MDAPKPEREEMTQIERVLQNLKKNPLIPIGFVATCGALGMAVRRMHQRDSAGYQRWLRARVVAQGFTIVAIVIAGLREYDKFFAKKVDPEIKVSPSERRAFEKRLKEAEDAHTIETGGQPESITASVPQEISSSSAAASSTTGKSWRSWFGGGKN